MDYDDAYHLAQRAIADLKGAVFARLQASGAGGLSNAELGRSLGIYSGHVGHEGHISRTVLALLESEGLVGQDETTKLWNAV